MGPSSHLNDLFFSGSLGVVLFSLFECYGILLQGVKIWKERSGESISTYWMVYFIAMAGSTTIYGDGKSDEVLRLCGLFYFFFRLPLLVGIIKYKKFAWHHWVFVVFLSAMLCIMYFSAVKNIFFICFCLGGLLMLGVQFFEMVFNNKKGVVEIKALIIGCIANFFWTYFGYKSDQFIMITSALYLVVYLFCILLYAHLAWKEKQTLFVISSK